MRAKLLVTTALVLLAIAPSCGSGSGGKATGGDGGTSGTDGGGGGGSGGSGGHKGGGDARMGDDQAAPGPDGSSGGGDAGACLGSTFLSAVGKGHLLVGGAMQAATAKSAPFDLQYIYISGGFNDGTGPCASCATGCTTGAGSASCTGSCAWWGCWQYDKDPPGEYVRGFASTCASEAPPQVPMITYYQILQASGVSEGAPEVTSAATDMTFMTRYFADWRFLLQQIGTGVALLHIEPDFWGYAEQHAADPTTEPAAVASANPKDCGTMPNTIAGMGKCMVAMTRTYAPHALVALHASAWSTNIDVGLNTSATLDVAGEAKKTAAFLAACGEADADYVVVETSDRDAGYYQTVEKRRTWWDATNAMLPDFHQDFAWVKALTEALGKPALWWQTPLGNSAQNNTPNHYQDNRVAYFLTHMNELASAHGVGAAFGAGAGDQTTPESDGGNFVSMSKTYFSSAGGGQALCK